MIRRIGLALALAACTRAPQELATKESPASTATPASSTATSVPPTPAPEPAVPSTDTTEPWNPKEIDWKPFDEGLALAKKENKPICLVLYTTWCPHCKNYSHVFSDPRLAMRSHAFVMIRVDADANDAVSRRYSQDGTYVPRTFILDSNGNVNPAGKSDHPRYAHFFDEMHADSLLDAMDQALAHR